MSGLDEQPSSLKLAQDAASVAEEAAHVAESAAAVAEEAAAVVQEAAAGVESAAERSWPDVERRRKPRLLRRIHEGKVEWKHIALYVPILLIAVAVGVVAIWSFITRQSLIIQPTPLPKVTLITGNPSSPFTAAWVRLLTTAEMQPTLVPLEKVEVLRGVVVLCDLPRLPSNLAHDLADFLRRGGAVAVLGTPPETPLGSLQLSADAGMSDNVMRDSEAVSPILSRLNPGHEFAVRPTRLAFLKETPRMNVDVRWKTNARAVVMHMEQEGARFLWIGFDPDTLYFPQDPQLLLMLRTAFRWVAGQPVSDGAVGSPQTAKTLTPEARRAAQAKHFVFSVDALSNPNAFSIRMTNRGKAPLENPTVKVWLPPGVTEVKLTGDPLNRRDASLTGVPEEGACLVSLPRLNANEDRAMKLKIVKRRRAGE